MKNNEFELLSWKPVHLWYFDIYISDDVKTTLSTYGLENVQLFYDGRPYHIKTSPLIYSAKKWTGFYMIGTFVMKELIFIWANQL